MKQIFTLFITLVLYTATGTLHAQGWSESGGPPGGDVQSFIYTTGTIFAGTMGSGIFRQSSTNTWIPSGNGLTGWGEFVTDFARIDSVVFASTFGGMYKTGDEGQTWTACNNGLPNKAAYAVERHLGYIYAGLDSGAVYRSSDLGDTWVPANGDLNPYLPVNCLTFLGDYLFAGTAGEGVWFTEDYGTHWQHVPVYTSPYPEYVLQLHAVAGRIYAGLYGNGIFYLPITGGGWHPANTGLLDLTVYSFTALSTLLYCGTEEGVHWSSDWGDYWIPSLPGMRNHRVRSLIADGTNVLAGTYGGGIYRQLAPNTNWLEQNQGLKASVVQQLAVTEPYDGNIYACTFGMGLFRRDTMGGSWVDITPGFVDGALEINRFYNRGDTLYVATNGGVYYSVNQGSSWTSSAWGIPASPITALAFHDGSVLAATWTKGVFTASDLASFWTKKNSGFPTPSATNYQKISDMIHQGDSLFLIMEPDYLFRLNRTTQFWDSLQAPGLNLWRILRLAADDSILYAMGYTGLFYSLDFGETWAPDTLGLGGVNVRSMRLLKDIPGGFDYYAHVVSEDGRLFFQDSAFGRWREEPLNGTGFVVDVMSDTHKSYASFYGKGVWTTRTYPVEFSTFSGFALDSRTNVLEWRTESEANNRGFEILRSRTGSEWENRGFVSGAGNSDTPLNYAFEDPAGEDYWYRLRQQDFDGAVSFSPIIQIRKHIQSGDYQIDAYPNPFSDAATVAFTVQDEAPLTLRVIDVLGRTLFERNEEAQSGSRVSYTWDGTDASGRPVPPGTYVVTLLGDRGAMKASMRIVKR